MIRFDTHVHTTFSPDGRSAMEAYARRVDEGAVDALGFTEHYEFWPGSDATGFFREEDFFAAVEGFRGRGYRFYPGAEVDWMPEYEAIIRENLARWPWAYTIASVHNLPTAEISGRNVGWSQDAATFDRILDEYHAQVASSLRVEAFTVVGHVGVYGRHLAEPFWGPWQSKLDELEDELAALLAASGKILEVNTSGLFCARGRTSAGAFLLERYRHHGGRRISFGSDAHEAGHVLRGFDRATELVRSLGFTEVTVPWSGEVISLE